MMILIALLSFVTAKRSTPFGEIPTVTADQKAVGIFDMIAIGIISTIHGVHAPNTGKIIQLERFDLGQLGTNHNAEFDYYTGYSRSLSSLTDIFCSTGFVSSSPDAKIFNVGGWNGPSLEAVRSITPCGNPGQFEKCNWIEDKTTAILKLPRWYPTSLPLPSGKVAIIGGTTAPTGLQPPAINQPSVEFIPIDKNQVPITLNLLVETDTYNLYPIAYVLSNGVVFLLSGTRSQLLNIETFQPLAELAEIGEGKRTYPFTGGSAMLALKSSNGWISEILVCGGSSGPTKISASLQTCGRLTPTIQKSEWIMELMPYARLMPDMVNLPDGTVLIINGALQGWSGFDSAQGSANKPVLYDPELPFGKRFAVLAASPIPRMYHSVAFLVEDGSVIVMGSAPNANSNELNPIYANEQRIEVFYPPYLLTGAPRPHVLPLKINKIGNNQSFELYVENYDNDIVSLNTNGFVTHSNHQGQRMVICDIQATKSIGKWFKLTVNIPDANIALPGWYMVFVTRNKMPSIAQWILIGNDPQNFKNWPIPA